MTQKHESFWHFNIFILFKHLIVIKFIVFTLISPFKNIIYFENLPAKAFYLLNFNQVNVYTPEPFTIVIVLLFTIDQIKTNSIVKVIII